MEITVLGKNIAALRKERGIKQEDLANSVGVSAQAVSKWENGGVPDTELIPKIADFFGVSIDSLFGRNIVDYKDIHTALVEEILAMPDEKRVKTAFEFCWDIERALFGISAGGKSIAEYEKSLGDGQRYSSCLTDYGYTLMGIANKRQYFYLAPEPNDTEKAFFDGIDYPAFFADLADKNVFDTIVMLNKRDHKKAFTESLLMKNMGFERSVAESVIEVLKKYSLITVTNIEMDDEINEVYTFRPTASFVALLTFSSEMIVKPNCYNFYCANRSKPYL